MEHDHGITFGGIKLVGFHHPSVEGHSFLGGEREELLLGEVELAEPLTQCGIVDHGAQQFALQVVYRALKRSVGIAEGGDIIAEVGREKGFVPSLTWGEEGGLPLVAGDIHLALQGRPSGCLVKESLLALVVAIDFGHAILGVGELAYQPSVKTI